MKSRTHMHSISRPIIVTLVLGCLGSTAWAAATQTRSLISAGGQLMTNGTMLLNGNFGDILSAGGKLTVLR